MIRRKRLLDRIAAPGSGNWLIEAAAGYGKSVLLGQLRADAADELLIVPPPLDDPGPLGFLNELASSARRAGLPELAETVVAVEGDPSALLAALQSCRTSVAVDDIQSWQGEVVDFIDRMASAAESSTQFMLSGRHSPASIDRVGGTWGLLTAQELAFTAEETVALLDIEEVDTALAPVLHQFTNGWPLAIASGLRRMTNSSEPALVAEELGRTGSLIDGLLAAAMAGLDACDAEAASALAHLPFFDEVVADQVGQAGLLDRLLKAGLPITRRADGWSEVADQFRAPLLRHSSPNRPELLAMAVDQYLARGEITGAIHACLNHGEHRHAAQLIAGLSPDDQSLVEPAMLNAAMATISDVADEVPLALKVQAQVNASFGRVEEGARYLGRAIEIVERTDPALANLSSIEILLEHALWQILQGDPDGATVTLERCPLIVEGDCTHLQAQRHDVQGLIAFTHGSAEALERSVAEQTKALALWRSLGDSRHSSVTVFRLASGALRALGRHTDALGLLEDLPSVGPLTLVNQARLAMEKAMVLPYVGRAAEVPALAGEARRLAAMLGHSWVTPWALWAEVTAASLERSDEDVEHLAASFKTHADQMDDFSRGIAWSDLADALARCDFATAAQAAVQRAEALPTPGVLVELARLSPMARFGDPNEATELAQSLRTKADLPHGRRWYVELLDAYAAHRIGDSSRAAELLQSSFDMAGELGQPALPTIVDSKLVGEIQSGGSAHRVDERSGLDVVEVAVFHEFAVSINGKSQRVSNNQATTLVKLIVLHEGKMLVDQAIDPLWPDTDLVTGRRRLRNVLLRVREQYGDLVVRSGDVLELRAGISSDYQRAMTLSERVMAEPASISALSTAIAAVDRPLLPEHRYDDWAEEARRRLEMRQVRLLDLQASVAESEGEVDIAVAALQRAHTIDRHESTRLDAAAALLREAGREAAASALSGSIRAT